MKRRMEHGKMKGSTKTVDPGMAAAKKVPHKKTERDVFPESKVPKGLSKRRI